MKKIILGILSVVMLSQSFTSFAAIKDRSEQLETLSDLIVQCEVKGISVPYQKLVYNIIERFEGYQQDDEANGEPEERINYNETALDNLYRQASDELNSYLNGEAYPVLDGESDYSIGYGHFNQAINDIPNFKKFGVDNVQYEIGPKFVIKGYGGWEETVSGTADAEETDGYMLLTADDSSSVVLSQTVYLKGGETYTIGYEYKGNVPNSQTLMVGVQGSETSAPYIASGSEDVWKTRAEKTYTATNSGTYAFVIRVKSVTAGIYVDNVYMNDSNGNNLLGDAGFEGETFYNIDYNYIETKVNDVLESAKNSDVNVHLLLSPHYFPEFVINDNPDMVGDSGFLPCNIMHPAALSVMEAYLRAVFSQIDDYSALESIILSNEVMFTTNIFGDFFREDYNAYLEKIHGTVDNMNTNYGKFFLTKYNSFSKVPMSVSATPEGYDYVNFNEDILTGWHQWMKNIIRDYTDTPVSIKMISNINDTESGFFARGTDAEKFATVTDWTGHDASAYYDSGTEAKIGKNMWYDYLKSTTGQTVFNSEDHIIADRSDEYSEVQARHVINDMWQGALHGRNVTGIWLWERSHNTTYDWYASISTRPDCVYGVGKTAYDLDRLSEEIAVLTDEQPKVAILYSKASRIYDTANATASLQKAYRQIQFAGYKTGFVSEYSLDKLSGYDILVVPRAPYVKKSVLDAIEDFITGGGEVIRTYSDSLKYDEYKKPSVNANILNNSVLYEGNALGAYLKTKSDVTISANNIVYQSAKDGDTYYVNLCNYNDDVENSLYIQDREVITAKELISNEFYSGIVKKETPTLIEIKTGIPQDVEDISSSENEIMWKSSDANTVGYNVYFDEKLVATVFEEVYSTSSEGLYTIKAFNSMGDESEGQKAIICSDRVKLVAEIGNNVEVEVSNNFTSELACNIEIAGYDTENKLVSLSGSKIVIPSDDKVNVKSSLYSNAVKYIISVKDPESTEVYVSVKKE